MAAPEVLAGGPAERSRRVPLRRVPRHTRRRRDGSRLETALLLALVAVLAWSGRGLVDRPDSTAGGPTAGGPTAGTAAGQSSGRSGAAVGALTGPQAADAARDPGFALLVAGADGLWRTAPGHARGPRVLPAAHVMASSAGRHVLGSDGARISLLAMDARTPARTLGAGRRILSVGRDRLGSDAAWVVVAEPSGASGAVIRALAVPAGTPLDTVHAPARWEVQHVLPTREAPALVLTRPGTAVSERQVVTVGVAGPWSGSPVVVGRGVYLGAGSPVGAGTSGGRLALLPAGCGGQCPLHLVSISIARPHLRSVAPPAGWTFVPGPVSFLSGGVVAFVAPATAPGPLALAFAGRDSAASYVVPGTAGAAPGHGLLEAPGGVAFLGPGGRVAYWAVADATGARFLDRFLPATPRLVCACG